MTEPEQHSLYLTGRHPELDNLRAVTELRKVLVDLIAAGVNDVPATSHGDARIVLDVLDSDGLAFLGSSEDEAGAELLSAFREKLRAAGFGAQVDPDVERLTRNHETRRMTAEGATPEQVFGAVASGAVDAPEPPSAETHGPMGVPMTPRAYRMALILLAAHEGNPLFAALTAIKLGRADGDLEKWVKVVHALGETHPWIMPELVKAGELSR